MTAFICIEYFLEKVYLCAKFVITHTNIYVHTHIHINIHSHIHSHTHTYINIHSHIHSHTQTFTHIHPHPSPLQAQTTPAATASTRAILTQRTTLTHNTSLYTFFVPGYPTKNALNDVVASHHCVTVSVGGQHVSRNYTALVAPFSLPGPAPTVKYTKST